MKEQLEIINENDEVVGIESRDAIHQKGLLHREIHVWFFTPDQKIIFQHRAKNKDTFPDLLDATVGGHVEISATYEETALKETQEETGIETNKDNLHFIKKMRGCHPDKATGMINNVIRAQFAYYYQGNVADLQLENGQGLGFEAWSISELPNLNQEDRKKFIPNYLEPEFLELFNEMQTVLKK